MSRRKGFQSLIKHADERVVARGFEVVRSGKMVAMRNVMTGRDQHDFTEAMNSWRETLPAEMAVLEADILRFNPMDVLAYAVLRDAIGDPETYKEYEYGSVVKIEHLATLFAKHPPRTTFEDLSGETMNGVFDLLDRLAMYWPFAHERFDPSIGPPQLLSIRNRVLMSETLVRMPSYRHQIEATAIELFTPYAGWLRTHIGFDADDAVSITRAITTLQNDRLNDALHEGGELPRRLMEALHGRGSAPAELQQTMDALRAMSADQQTAYLTDLGVRISIKAIGTKVPFTEDDIAAVTGIPVNRVAAFMDFFNLRFGDVPADYIIPNPAYPMKIKPLLRLPDQRLFAPSPMLLEPALQISFEQAMNPSRSTVPGADQNTWDSYVVHRAEYAEQRALQSLSKVLRNADAYRGLKYRHNGSDGELDGLLLFDRYAIFVEVKAGTFSPQARSGDMDALVGDIQKLVRHPHEQGERALGFIREAKTPTFRLADGTKLPIDAARFTRALLVTVTLEQLGQVTAALSEFPLDASRLTPWGVNVHDLEIIAEHVGGPVEFLQFVQRRVEFNRTGEKLGYDELDWLGRYCYDSLEFDDVPVGSDSLARVSLMSHTTELDAYYLWKTGVRKTEPEKPVHPLQPQIAQLINDMHATGALGWTDAALLLLDTPTKNRSVLDRKLQKSIAGGKPFVFECVSNRKKLVIQFGDNIGQNRAKRADAVLQLEITGKPVQLQWRTGEIIAFTRPAAAQH